MADQQYDGPPSGPPPQASGAPGTASHLSQPPIPPLNIPQNTNPIPTAITSPMNNGPRITSPQSAGGFVRRAAPELNKRNLYVGGLDSGVKEELLKQIFETAGHVVSIKIIPEKHFQSQGQNYGFIEYDDPAAAENAMNTLNGRKVLGKEIRINWAYHPNTTNKEDTTAHYHIFVGDLSNEVNDEALHRAFSVFGEISEARVMWDMKTGRSRGYGFVAYRDRNNADKAMSAMDGEWLGARQIRCNWANQKGQPSFAQQAAMAQLGMPPTYNHPPFPTNGMNSYEQVLSQSPPYQTTVYAGNLTPYTTQNDLAPLFMNFGAVIETRMSSDRGFAFVKMETHEQATAAICGLNGYMVNGRPIKCSWGKDRPTTMQFENPQSPYSPYSPQQAPSSAFQHSGYPQSAGGYGQFQQYGQISSPQGQGSYGSPAGPYSAHPSSAGGFQQRQQGGPQGGPGQWQQPQQSGGYPQQSFGYQG